MAQQVHTGHVPEGQSATAQPRPLYAHSGVAHPSHDPGGGGDTGGTGGPPGPGLGGGGGKGGIGGRGGGRGDGGGRG
eukprot:scaffold104470_cov63-Phaeocystis_antarctica.AAC.1